MFFFKVIWQKQIAKFIADNRARNKSDIFWSRENHVKTIPLLSTKRNQFLFSNLGNNNYDSCYYWSITLTIMFSDLYAFHDQPLCVCILNLLLCFILLWNSFMIHEVMPKKWMPGLSFGYVIIQREINNIRKLCKIVLFLRFQQIQWFSVFQDTLKRVKDTPVRDVFSQADPGWKIYCNCLNILHVWTLFSLPYNKLYRY